MRSLNSAICTSGEPVSFGCVRNCSMTSALTSINSSSPLKRRALLYVLCLFNVKNASTYACRRKGIFGKSRLPPGLPTGRIRRRSGPGVANQRQKFVSRLLVLSKRAQHRAGRRDRILFFHASHHHAQMSSLDDHSYALWRKLFLDGLGN